MPNVKIKKISPSVRTIYGHLERLLDAGVAPVTPALLATEAGWSYSAEISSQLTFLYDCGYVGRLKEDGRTKLSILKPLPTTEIRT